MKKSKYYLKNNSFPHINICVAILITLISVLLIIFCKYQNIVNIAISIAAAGIYIILNELFIATYKRNKMKGLLHIYYRELARDLYLIVLCITGEESWNKMNYIDMKKCSEKNKNRNYYERDKNIFAKFNTEQGEFYLVDTPIDILKLSFDEYMKKFGKIDDLLEYIRIKKIVGVFEFEESLLKYRLQIISTMPEDEPKGYKESLLKEDMNNYHYNYLNNELRIRLFESEQLIMDVVEFVNSYFI